MTVSTIEGSHGSIAVHDWPVAEPSWIAILVHGYGEHLGRYPHVATRLNAAGATVSGPDHEGHGVSAGDRVLIEDFETVVDDVDAVVSRAVAGNPGLPVIMIGHSMGGMIAARYAQRHRDRLLALVLSGPVLGSWHPTALAELDEIPDDPLDTSTLSRDDAVGAVYSADPLVWHGPFKRPMLRSIARTLEVINDGGELGDLPTLWVHGEADTLVPIGPTREGIERLRGTDLTEIVYPEARHEVFNEINQDAVLDDVIEFARRRVESADLG
ncbi:alpha/beta fold hydrolase [Microlunatus sp. GCM10028923]|uniref:alpha/beta fold hydrolase n=1 Tax=Microlunatus sp. GCM10028923 TaxID=3273400 RepID=UPI003607BD49